jgi:hypothetical protein
MEILKTVFSYVNAFIFISISCFHYYWAFGGKYGYKAVLPESESTNKKVFIPGKFATFIVATLFLLIATGFFLIGQHPIVISTAIPSYFLYTMVGFTFMRAVGDFKYVGFFKKKSSTLFAINDAKYYSPLCLYIALTTAYIVIT